MHNSRGDIMSRLGSQNNRPKFPRVEYVNRAGQRVNPLNGKPYNRPAHSSSVSGNGVLRKRKTRKNNLVRSGNGNNFPIKLFGVMFGGLNPIPTNPTIDPPPRVCYNCWQLGHSKKDCPRPVIAKICNNCGRRGEDLSTCPRCSVAHMRYLAHLRGEQLDENDLQQLFSKNHEYDNVEESYHEDKRLDDCDDVLRQIIEQSDREHEVNNYYDEHDREVAYEQPQVKYLETREYVKNPVNRLRQSRDYEEQIDLHDRREEYDYEDRDQCQEERGGERDNHPRYRDRESSEDRSVERYRRAANSSFNDLDSDPVQEILQLTKSIAHLSAETQEMIMKQVMAERREKARLRAIQDREKDRVVDEDWL